MITNVSKAGKEHVDLLSHDFVNNRRIFIFEEITPKLAMEVISQLEYLDKQGKEDITLFINSDGGRVDAGYAIVDAMNRCKADVATVCTGMAASMGAFILAAGAKGKRFCTPLSEVMIHQPVGGASGQATDIELVAEHIARTKKQIYKLLSDYTGQSEKRIAADCERDYYITAEKAVEYGIVDKVLGE